MKAPISAGSCALPGLLDDRKLDISRNQCRANLCGSGVGCYPVLDVIQPIGEALGKYMLGAGAFVVAEIGNERVG